MKEPELRLHRWKTTGAGEGVEGGTNAREDGRVVVRVSLKCSFTLVPSSLAAPMSCIPRLRCAAIFTEVSVALPGSVDMLLDLL